MNLQALLIRASVSIAAGLALTAAIAFDHPTKVAAAVTPVITRIAPATASAAAPVMLPTIHVRPSANQRFAVAVSATSAGTSEIVPAVYQTNDANATSAVSGLRMDMPYYSFGKVLPRVGSKE